MNDMNLAIRDGIATRSFFKRLIDTTFKETVDPMYAAGYRNFLLLNQPPMNRRVVTPSRASSYPTDTMMKWWNGELEKRAKAWQKARNGGKAMVFDANTLLNRVMDEPNSYGIKNTTGNCDRAGKHVEAKTNPEKFGCQVPIDEYFWFDSGHM